MTIATHLIIVCCHAIYLGPDSSDESNWLIEPFQKGETGTYSAHVEAGVRELAADESALLVFSGGPTKKQRTDQSEGDGYLKIAVEHGLFGLETSPPSLRQRIFVDRFATDSYQNILCSLVQFPLFAQEFLDRSTNTTTTLESSGSSHRSNPSLNQNQLVFPSKLTIISHEFKRARFLDLHLPALRWTRETNYIGINPPFDAARMAEIETGDRLRGYGAWEKDVYGVGEVLTRKRKARDWDEDRFRADVLQKLKVSDEARRKLENVVFRRAGGDSNRREVEKMPWE
ncbi:uncharacterized protein Z518_10123 [Rhinocladiella mackenziei CBS 650.93]|uniref:DUF218 domain-containing protein n=1 Tax=Rhinocladiella mackenziei CBS 650.93 TaxID=1442369 RepID=A0A0D2FGF2_9EURO|nr:uncharacterized protein Z518_10123 [Rhinocladiella mackenziei CBS 650.93]KIX01057.1 hypothetical protein Z518_10123 [Rhinocladiella mackenziei CBS 650.93]